MVKEKLNEADAIQLNEKIVEAMQTVYDPEIHVNIYDLGLIYKVSIDEDSFVNVNMTLTAPACPVAGILPKQVEQSISSVKGVAGAKVTLVWEPPWNQAMLSDEAKLSLGLL
jgi:FeS assembly SUF system protein